MNIQSVKDWLIITAFSANILLKTLPIRKIISTVLRHWWQWAYDALPTEPIDIVRKKTLITQIPIQWWTVWCNARLVHCLTKSVFLTELWVYWQKMQNDISHSISNILSWLALPEHMDKHTFIALSALILSTTIYYWIIKSTDIKAELNR